MLTIETHNEWDQLHSVVLGTAEYANWPKSDLVFKKSIKSSPWKQSKFKFGPVDQNIIKQAEASLDNFRRVFDTLNIKVYRPMRRDYQAFRGFYGYCPRDTVLVIGKKIICAPMTYPSRRDEWSTLTNVLPNNQLIHCDEPEVKFDAANICRCNKDILYLKSSTGNRKGARWLQEVLGDEYRVNVLDNIYSGVHIDSTITPLREGLVLLNAGRITEENVPVPLKSWDKIWLHENEIVHQNFVSYPYASNWIALNLLSINPNLVICDPKQTVLRKKLDQYKIESIGVDLIHSRTLGGGHHCVTLDLNRR